jgi:hypothetical protein
MSALLDYNTLFHHHNHICIFHGGEAMGDEKYRSTPERKG